MTVFDFIVDVKISKDDLTLISIALGSQADFIRANVQIEPDGSENLWERIDANRIADRLEDLSERLIKASRGGNNVNV